MRISQLLRLALVFSITIVSVSAVAQETDNSKESTFRTALTFGFGASSLNLEFEGNPENTPALMLRLERFDDSTSYALQYSKFAKSVFLSDFIDDIFSCIFSFDNNCGKEPQNTTTLSEWSFLYGWQKPETTYSLGVSYIRSINTMDKQYDYKTFGLVGNVRTKLPWIFDGMLHVDLNDKDSFAVVYLGVRFE